MFDNDQIITLGTVIRLKCKWILFPINMAIKDISYSWSQQRGTWTEFSWIMLHGDRAGII